MRMVSELKREFAYNILSNNSRVCFYPLCCIGADSNHLVFRGRSSLIPTRVQGLMSRFMTTKNFLVRRDTLEPLYIGLFGGNEICTG